jgi:3-oxoacyl-[acyl-carrier protein] reductase
MTKKKGRVQDRTAIVTGSSRGIGKAIAILLAKEGAKIVVNYNKSDKAAQEIVKNIEQIGSKTLVIQADVGKKLKSNIW